MNGPFLSDAAGVVGDFAARGLDLVGDFEQQNDTPAARLNGPVPRWNRS